MDAVALALVGLAAVLVVLHWETVRRLVLRREDPRTMAAFRIACGLCTIGWTLELWPLADYLFSDEGLFLTDTARQVFAAGGFAGIADGSAPGEPAGPLDGAAIVQLVASPRQSLLFFFDDPASVRLHLVALVGAAVLLTLGAGTTVAKWATLLLFHSLAMRNSISWAGEQVFWCFMLPLCLSQCGRAWSVDAWLRRRGDDETIPGWPRVLALLQTIPLFFANGLAKSGEMWAAGDTFHYLVMHPDFQRFDPTALAELGATTVFRAMTWGAHAFELLYPLAIVGVVARFRAAERIPALVGRRALTARIAWVAVALAIATLCVRAYEGRERATLCFAIVIGTAVAIAVLAILGERAAPVRAAIVRVLGSRRLWVTLVVGFTGSLALFVSLGWFVPLTMATAILLVDGPRGAGASAPPTSPVRRAMIGWFCTFHVVAVTLALLPREQDAPVRGAIERPLQRWLAHAHTLQTWRMFAPSGTRNAVGIALEVTDAGGTTHAIGDGLPGEGPGRLGRDKLEKIRRRLATGEGQGTWYTKWHGRHACRRWALAHGELPAEVTLWRVTQAIAPPEDPRRVEPEVREPIWQQRCAHEVQGQPPGSPAFVPWIKRRAESWAELRARGEAPDLPWWPAILLAPWPVVALRRRLTQRRGR